PIPTAIRRTPRNPPRRPGIPPPVPPPVPPPPPPPATSDPPPRARPRARGADRRRPLGSSRRDRAADGAGRRRGGGGGLACGRIHASRGSARAEGPAPASRSPAAVPAGALLCRIRRAGVHRRGIVLALDLGDAR